MGVFGLEQFGRQLVPSPQPVAALLQPASEEHRARDFEEELPAEGAVMVTPPGQRKRKRAKPPGRSTPPPVSRQGYRREVDQWKNKMGIRTIAEAARKLVVGVDTLKSIRSSRGKLRCSEKTLKAVLKKIGAPNP
jgi:hypothetical protein